MRTAVQTCRPPGEHSVRALIARCARGDQPSPAGPLQSPQGGHELCEALAGLPAAVVDDVIARVQFTEWFTEKLARLRSGSDPH